MLLTSNQLGPKHNGRGQMLPRQGERGENTPFTNNADKRSAYRPRDPREGNNTE